MSTKELQDTLEYKAEQAKYGTGSDLQRGIQVATAALRGLAGSDLAGASAPELTHLLKSTEGNPAVNIMAHAVLGGAIAALQGNSIAAGAAGAAGAATGELAARALAGMLYPDAKDLSKLSEEQKQTVSALATIAAGMAGGLAGNSTGSAVVGGQAGKNAVENNYLSTTEKSRQTGLNYKQNLTPQEKQERDALNRKDSEVIWRSIWLVTREVGTVRQKERKRRKL